MSGAILVEKLNLGGEGLRVAIKDCIDIAGLPTRSGSAALSSAKPATAHADVVQSLLDAGCKIIGKTNMHELAYGVTGINAWSGTPTNPLYPAYVPGGSSSGSAAAVAAGLCDFAIGTDTGGSIRTPAACCGVIGFKPSFGRISRRGSHPDHSSLDCIGPLATTMPMIEQALAIIDPDFSAAPLPSMLRLGRVTVDAEADVSQAFDAVMDHVAGALVTTYLDMKPAFHANMALIGRETWNAFGYLTASGLLGADVQERLCQAGKIDDQRILWAENIRQEFRAKVDAALADVDALILPAMPIVPLRMGEAIDADRALAMTAFVRPFNLSGHPAITLPVRMGQRFPIAIQLIGRMGEDAALCAAARQITEILASSVAEERA